MEVAPLAALAAAALLAVVLLLDFVALGPFRRRWFRRRQNLAGRVAVITGAAGGLGPRSWPGHPGPDGPPAGTGREALHYVDAGAGYLNSSLETFLASFPRARHFTYHLLEPSPHAVATYARELARLRVPAQQVEFAQAAVWDADNLTLTSDGLGVLDASLAPSLRSLGSTRLQAMSKALLKLKPHFGGCGIDSACVPWHAPTIDFARWLKSRFKPSDYVVLKLDVDGSEWRVLPHLEAANVTSLLDEVYVEWHTDDMGITQTYGGLLGLPAVFGHTIADKRPIRARFAKAGVQLRTWP